MDQEALEKIFRDSFAEYGDAIFRFCMVKVSHVQLAEDMTQEVFMRYWQYLRDGKKMTNTRSFLYTIAHNMAKDWYKKKKSESLDSKIEAGFTPADDAIDAENMASYNEILEIIDDLEEHDKEVLLLTYVEGLQPKDIALIVTESANAISVRLNRATKRLKEKLRV